MTRGQKVPFLTCQCTGSLAPGFAHFASMTGQNVLMYHFSFAMSMPQLGVKSMFSVQGFEAQRHISFCCLTPFFTGTTMTRMPAARTFTAAFRALFTFEALPSVTSKTTCCRLLLDPTANIVFAASSARPVYVHPRGHFMALTFEMMSSFLLV